MPNRVLWSLVTAAAALVISSAHTVRAEDKKDAPAPAKVETVDFRKLKELMPAELNGLKRTANNGEKNKVGEFSISQARATYGKGGDDDDGKAPRIEVEVIDYSSTQMAQGLAAAWAAVEVDKESDDGFEKTVKIAGHPGHLTWQKEDKHGELQLLVGNRYILTLRTNHLPSEQVTKIAEALPLAKLAELK